MYDLFYSEQIDRSSGEAILLFFANILHSEADTQATVLRGLNVVPMLLSAWEMDFSAHTNVRCLSAVLAMARRKELRSRVLVHLDMIMANMNVNLSSPSRDENFYSTAAVHCALLCELTRSTPDSHQQLADASIIEALLMFVTLAGRGPRDEVCVELLLSAVFGISTMVASPAVGEQCLRSMLSPVTRMQLFLGLLRLPAEAINSNFYSGTVGVRTLQRTAAPDITDEELEVGEVGIRDFLSYCGVKPADFMYRNIIRTLCIAIANPELRHRIQDATSLQNIVPTCVFALNGTSDIYLQVFGYILVAIFGGEKQLRYGFVNSSAIINELLTCCRRYSDPLTSGMGTSVEEQLKKLGGGGGPWSPQSVALNRYLLAMLALTHLADHMRNVYRLEDSQDGEQDEEDREVDGGADGPDGKLSYSNLRFVARLAPVSFRELDPDMLVKNGLTEIQEFTALLRVVVVHNALLTRIELEEQKKGGEVKPELVGAVAQTVDSLQDVKTDADLVPDILKQEFKSLRSVQEKCLGLLNVVDWYVGENRSQALVVAIMESLGSLSWLCPMSVDMPQSAYRIMAHCPEWLQPGLLTVMCNIMSDPSRIGKEDERPIADRSRMNLRLGEVDSDYLFPLLATSEVGIRQRTLGLLANLSTHPGMLRFVVGSGVIRIYQAMPDRSDFLNKFGIIIEQMRILANTTCRDDSHESFCTMGVIQFLRDAMRHSSDLLHAAAPLDTNRKEAEEQFDYCEILFGEYDAPPLGLRIRWEQPPVLNEILPDTPAEQYIDALAEGDELIEINGIDVSYMEQEDIAPMFQDRPLRLVFRRRVDESAPVALEAPALTAKGDATQDFGGLQVVHVESIGVYGDRDQYLECFNLAVLAVHNIATVSGNHEMLFNEPQILSMLLAAIPSQVISPGLRRLIFSALTCLAQGKDMAGRVFQAMSDYFISCEKTDPSLQKYIMLCANLYYTGMRPEDIKPDRSMLVFVEQISLGSPSNEANRAVAEIMHGMAKAPKDLRVDFVSRDSLVVAVTFMECMDQWEVQSRAFESVYFLTMGACDPELWVSLDLLQRMARAASRLQQKSVDDDDEMLRNHAEALWEITLRTCDICLQWESLVHEVNRCAEIDRYLVTFFFDAHRSRPLMVKVVAHFMETLIDCSEGTCWCRWRNMGMADKIIGWFAVQSEAMKGDAGAALAKQKVMSPLAAEFPVPAGESVDSMLHMLVSATRVDPTTTGVLLTEGVMSAMAQRIIAHAGFYRKHHAEPETMEMQKANVAFRAIAQHLGACINDVEGLTALSGMGLEAHLVSLLELPPEDYRTPSLLVLAALCGHKGPCYALLKNSSFVKVLRTIEAQLESHGSALEAEELEYFACILDKSCCHPELTQIIVGSVFRLLCLLCVKGRTIQCQLLASRALARCALAKPDSLHVLTDPSQGLQYLHHVMSVASCLRKEGFADEESQHSIDRRAMVARVAHSLEENPQEGQLVDYFSRVALCEERAEKKASSTVAPKEVELAAGGVLNSLITMLHVLLCVVFRQGSEKEAATLGMQMAMARVMGAIGRLALPDAGEDDEEEADAAPAALAELLTGDIRVIFYLSALLREVCSQPFRSGFLAMVRTPPFFLALEACVTLAVQRLQREVKREPHKDILRPKVVQQVSVESPMAGRVDNFSLAFVFEHVLVCLRHSLVQAMYVKADPGSSRADPWHWQAQEKLKVHLEVMTWLPEVMRQFVDTRAIKVEAVRYLCAVATFYEAPQAQPQDADYQEDEEGEDIVPANPEESGTSAYRLAEVFSLSHPDVLGLLTEVLETDEDPCTLTLAMQGAANLASYERRRRLGHSPPTEELPVDGLTGLVAATVRTLRLVSSWQPEYVSDMLLSANRLIGQLLCCNNTAMSSRLVTLDMFKAMQEMFDVFLKDAFKLKTNKEFHLQVQSNIQLLRSFVCAGCLAEVALEQEAAGARQRSSDAQRSAALSSLSTGLDAPELVNLIVLTAGTLVATGGQARQWRKGAHEEPDAVISSVFDDVTASLQTLLRRTDINGGIDWDRVELFRFEQMMKDIQAHRRQVSGIVDDEVLLNLLYLMTKQGYVYGNQHFPDYLMEVAYSQRESHTTMQDIAAVCFAMVTALGKLRNGGQINVANVVKNHAEFVLSLAQVSDPRLKLWHYRLLTQWTKKPHVLKEISADAAALRFVIDALLDESLGRYSVVILHNISVLRCATVMKGKGQLAVACEAYRRMVPGSQQGDEANRRMLRKLVLATVRNVLFGVEDLQTELGDEDLAAIVELVTAIEAPDVAIFMAMLMHVCDGCSAERAAKSLAGHGALLEFLVRNVYGFASACQPGAGDIIDVGSAQDLYGCVMQLQEPPAPSEGEGGLKEPGSPSQQRGLQPAAKGLTPPPGPTSPVKGLGKKMTLYQQSRRRRVATSSGMQVVQERVVDQGNAKAGKGAERQLKEFLYFASVEVLSHATFVEGSGGPLAEGDEDGQPAAAGRDCLEALFGRNPITAFLKTLREQVQLHERKRVVFSDLFMHVSAKFIWHCWSNPMFRRHIDTPLNLEALAALTPFFLEWPNQDVQGLTLEICLYAGLHRYPIVRDYLCEKHTKFPELTAAALGHAMVDPEGDVAMRQAMQYLKVFAQLLRSRCLSQKGLRRLVISLQGAMLASRPEGLCASLAQKDSQLFGELLEQLKTYWEAGYVKQGMAVMIALTVGSHYKPLQELDSFVLHILDFAPSLLESEFVLFFPVLCRLASLGGKRIQLPMLQRKVHVRVARLLEKATGELEAELKSGEPEKTPGIAEGAWKEPKLGARQRIQWILAFFVTFASVCDPEEGDNVNTHAPDVHFDSFVCVDLLQILMRILRTQPHPFEASAACFLISCVSYANTLPAYMPDLLRVSVKAFPSLIDEPTGKSRVRSPTAEAGPDSMLHLRLPSSQRMELGLRRSFIHLLANAGYLPASSPSLTSNAAAFRFLVGLGIEHGLYQDPAAPLHTKLYCLAHMVTRTDDYNVLFDDSAMGGSGLFEVLTSASKQVLEEDADETCDLRVIWANSVVTIASSAGTTLLTKPEFRALLLTAIGFAETILHETCGPQGLEGGSKGLGLGFEFSRSLLAALRPLAQKVEFKELRQPYILYLLSMASSALLPSLRNQALDNLHNMITKSTAQDLIGALVMVTSSVETFKRIMCGGNEEMASSCIRCVCSLGELAGYEVNTHLLSVLETVIDVIGNPSMSATRILGLGEAFVSLTKVRAFEVIDAMLDVKDLTAFLGLARSSQAVRRELVGRWLETYGSSLYEVDEVLEVFRSSTARGFLHIAARCTLKPEEAQDFRRLVFAAIEKRVREWRGSISGLRDFLSEPLLSSMLPMCELQPDLTAAMAALMHSFITCDESFMLDRIWSGGHLAWLCRCMSLKSAPQVVTMRSAGQTTGSVSSKNSKTWERHVDLTVSQSMILRVIWELYKLYPTELCAKALKSDCLIKNWQDYIAYYCHHAWPLRESTEIEEATTTAIILAMLLAARVSHDSGESARSQLIQQGMLGLCFTVMLPPPPVQKALLASIGAAEETPGAEDGELNEVSKMPEAKLIAGDIATLLFRLPDSFKLLKARHFAAVPLAMFSQLHSWRHVVFEKQGSFSAVETVSLLERCASLYMSLVSSLSVEWCLEHLGLHRMSVMGPLFLDLWSRHGNPLLKQHSLRLFTSFCQVRVLYVHFLTQESRADALQQAVHRIFGAWDVRELRHVVWLLAASLAHALGIPVLPDHIEKAVKRALQDRDCVELSTVSDNLGAELADQIASKNMLLSTFLTQMISWCEQPPGDTYSRSWCLWMVAAILKHGDVTGAAAIRRAGEDDQDDKKNPEPTEEDKEPDVILVLPGMPEEEHLRRRAKFAAELAEVGVKPAQEQASPDGKPAAGKAKAAEAPEAAHCKTAWLRETPALSATLASMTAKCIQSDRKEFRMLGCVTAAACLAELPFSPPHFAEALDGEVVVRCAESKGERSLNVSALLLLSTISSFRLPLKAQNLSEAFLKRFFELQRVLLEGISRCGEHSFGLLASWLAEQPRGALLEADLRCLAAFVIGQCIAPPPATAPSLDLDTVASASPARVLEASPMAANRNDPPAVAECGPPPALLLDLLAQGVRRGVRRPCQQSVRKLQSGRETGLAPGRLAGSELRGARQNGSEAVGYEINPYLWGLSRLRSLRGAPGAGSAELRWANAWTADLREVDVVTFYGRPGDGLMEKAAAKCEAELPAHAAVVSHHFPMPGWERLLVQDVGGIKLYDLSRRSSSRREAADEPRRGAHGGAIPFPGGDRKQRPSDSSAAAEGKAGCGRGEECSGGLWQWNAEGREGAAVKVSPASPTGAAKTEGQLAAPSSLKELDKDGRSVQPAPSFTPSEVDQAQASITAEEMDLEAAKIKAQQGRSRRPGVAAESVDNDKVQNYKRPVHAKDKETEAKIRNILQDNKNLQVLFGHLQGQALTDVINAFYLKEISDGIDIIRQGDEGDCLYIIDSGTVEIFVRRGESTPGDKGKQVLTLGSGGLFGELALMYAAPRAATVTAASDTVRCFVLDALDFKMLLAQSSQAQYAKYEGWLHEVELLKSLNHFELSKLAEALQPEQYKPGDEIIKQGDPGDRFFILEEGTAAAYITGAEGEMEAP
ncbi:unnamed protein product [Prorocentrum cordatum]|uniref:HECT-type E3 ubiquitin transferase n=1 Tax=Prorocentrum cordatum TaxID=2364126 RepID=A0ABN9TGB1_9DINO|nr:unnamed protein product [Polarella glacialis]